MSNSVIVRTCDPCVFRVDYEFVCKFVSVYL